MLQLKRSIIQKSSVGFILTSEFSTNTSQQRWNCMTSLKGNLVICIIYVHKYAFKKCTSCGSKMVFLRNLPSGNNWKVYKNVHHSVAYNTNILEYEYQSVGMATIIYTVYTMDLWYRLMYIDIKRYSLHSIKFLKMTKKYAYCDACFC